MVTSTPMVTDTSAGQTERWPLTPFQRWGLAIMASLTMIVSYMDRTTFSILWTSMSKELNLSLGQLGLLTSAFSLAYLFAAPLAGWVLDRIGARRGMLWATVLWSLVAAAHAFAPGFAMLFGLRILLGLTEAPSFPGACQTVQRVLPPTERSRGMGFVYAGTSLGTTCAGLLAPLLLGWFVSWRAAFFGTAMVGLLWVPGWLLLSRPKAARELLASSPVTRAAQPKPSVWSVILHPAAMRGMIVVLSAAPLILFSVYFAAPFLTATFKIKPTELGRYVWAAPVCFDLGSIAFGWLASRIERNRIAAGRSNNPPHRSLMAIAGLFALACGLIPYASDVVAVVALSAIAMAGAGGLLSLLTADILARVPADRVSLAGSMVSASQALAFVLLGLFVGDIAQAHGFTPILFGAAICIVPGVLAWILWPPPPKTAGAPVGTVKVH